MLVANIVNVRSIRKQPVQLAAKHKPKLIFLEGRAGQGNWKILANVCPKP